MDINMRVNAISFTGKKERMQRQQVLDDRRDQMLDELLLSMAPEFMNGEADILIINTTADENDDLDMEVNVIKDEFQQDEFEGFAEVEVVQPKKTLLQKLKDVFKK